jgi:uncharacterized protein YdeI (YjbR/CyaY-like superfamily)
MDEIPTLVCESREAWRAWLEANHVTARAVWLTFVKKRLRRPGIRYEEAVEEALCFGWIDSIVRRVDEERYVQKFTPRVDTATWSPSNRERLRRLIAAGRMTPAGLAKAAAVLGEPDPPVVTTPTSFPPDLEARLRAEPAAWAAFERQPPSHRRRFVAWVTAGRQEETRLRRLAEAIERLSRGQPLGLK